MILPKNETESLLFSITKNFKTLLEQTDRKAEETLEFKLNKPRKTFLFNPPFQIKRDCMIGLISLEVYNSIFIINQENNKLDFYADTFDEFSFTEPKDELEEILNTSDITPYHLQHETVGPSLITAYKKLRSEKSNTDGYIMLLMGYAGSPFRDFESYLRIVVGLDENNFHLILKQYNAFFVTYQLSSGFYTIEDISKDVYSMVDHEGTLQIENDDLNKKNKPI